MPPKGSKTKEEHSDDSGQQKTEASEGWQAEMARKFDELKLHFSQEISKTHNELKSHFAASLASDKKTIERDISRSLDEKLTHALQEQDRVIQKEFNSFKNELGARTHGLEKKMDDVMSRVYELENDSYDQDEEGYASKAVKQETFGRPGKRERDQSKSYRHRDKKDWSKIINSMPTFDGKGSWEAFISTFKAVTDKLDVEEDDKLDLLKISLRNDAAVFKELIGDQLLSSFSVAVQKLGERYGVKEDEITTRRSLATIKQCVDESEDSFAERVNKLVRQAYPGATEDVASAMAVDAFLKGCVDKRAALIVANQSPPPANICEAVRKIKTAVSNQKAILGETSCQVRSVRAHREHGDYDNYDDSRNRRIYREYSDRRYDSPSFRRQSWRYDEGYGREDEFYRGRRQYRDYRDNRRDPYGRYDRYESPRDRGYEYRSPSPRGYREDSPRSYRQNSPRGYRQDSPRTYRQNRYEERYKRYNSPSPVGNRYERRSEEKNRSPSPRSRGFDRRDRERRSDDVRSYNYIGNRKYERDDRPRYKEDSTGNNRKNRDSDQDNSPERGTKEKKVSFKDNPNY